MNSVENIDAEVTLRVCAILGKFWTIFGHFNIIVQGYLSNHIFHTVDILPHFAGKDAKRGILLDEECQVDIESAFYRETVAKKYASLFHSTLHHNTGYFLQVITFSNGLFKLVFQNK